MADQAGPNQPQDQVDGFEIVTDTHSRSTDYRRRSANATVLSSGYSSTNTNGTRTIEQLWTDAGYKVEDQITMKFGSGKGKSLVRGYTAQAGEPGTITLKRSTDGRSFSFHLGYLFDRYPDLRPGGTVTCTLKRAVDSQGTPCIEINVKGGTAKRKGPTEEDETPKATKNDPNSKADATNKSDANTNAASAPAATDVAAAAQPEPAPDKGTDA